MARKNVHAKYARKKRKERDLRVVERTLNILKGRPYLCKLTEEEKHIANLRYVDVIGKAECPFCKTSVFVANDNGLKGNPGFDYFLEHTTKTKIGRHCKGSKKFFC